MSALFECSRSPSAELRESALRIFTAVPDLISDQHNDALKGVFSASLADPESQNVSGTRLCIVDQVKFTRTLIAFFFYLGSYCRP
jgi:hypothetical protein